jgi:hypothetical protein
MMSRQKLRELKKAARRKTAGMELPIQTMHALIDSNLEALDALEGGKSTQEQRAELQERERQLMLALADIRERIGPNGSRALYAVDAAMEMLRAKGPAWHRKWDWYTPRIAEEFDEASDQPRSAADR